MYEAAYSNDIQTLWTCLQQGMDANAPDENGIPPIVRLPMPPCPTEDRMRAHPPSPQPTTSLPASGCRAHLTLALSPAPSE